MSHTEYDIDPAILAGFIDESMDELNILDALFIDLEKAPEDLSVVDSIFRPIHSIKGSAAFFSLMKIKELTHHMEDVLDMIRKEKIMVSPDVIKSLLPGLDMLRNMFNRVHSGKSEIEDDDRFRKILDDIITICKAGEIDRTERIEEATVHLADLIFKLEEIRPLLKDADTNLVDEAEMIISQITPHIVAMIQEMHDGLSQETVVEDNPIETIINILTPPIHDILDDKKSARVREELVKLKDAADSPDTEEIVLTAIEDYDAFMQNIGFDELLGEMIMSKMEELRDKGTFKPSAAAPPPTEKTKASEPSGPPADQIAPESRRPKVSQKIADDKTMRVSEKNIDVFLSYVSELVVIEEMFKYLQKQLFVSRKEDVAIEFKRVLESFGDLSENLRQSILSVRKIPAKSILQKAHRIVRDIAESKGKSVSVDIQGENLQVDKSYIEILDAPFTHMIRNAVDHGIEYPAERLQASKPETGNIQVKIEETKTEVVLTISDDGKGLDHDAITRKAEELGLINPGEAVDNETIINLLFMPGISTAKEITDISGRGVGMDVVKKNIESAGGKIRIQSRPGEGSSFTISLPRGVNTQVMNGFLVQTGSEIYVMPISLISESFALEPENINLVSGKGEVVFRRGEPLPIIRLGKRLFSDSTHIQTLQSESNHENVAISVAINNRHYAVCVEEILGLQKVVLRDIEGLPIKADIFDGAAMLGDGRVAMVLGSDGLSKLAL